MVPFLRMALLLDFSKSAWGSDKEKTLLFIHHVALIGLSYDKQGMWVIEFW